jgi:hypothetical protein
MKDQLHFIEELIKQYLDVHFNNIVGNLIHNHPPLLLDEKGNICPYCKIHGNIFQKKKTLTVEDLE